MSFDICMIVHNDITNDSRVKREAATLTNQGWQVTIVCIVLENKDLPAIETVNGYTIVRVGLNRQHGATPKTMGKLFRLLRAIPLLIIQVRKTRARVVHGHDFPGLLLAALAGIWRRPVVYDSHELFFDRWAPDSGYPLLRIFPLLRPIERWLARRATAVIVVSGSIADTLAQRWHIPTPKVIRNAPDLRKVSESPVQLRQGDERVVVHTGSLNNGRHLPELVSALAHLPDDVHLVLLGDGGLRQPLIAQAQAAGTGERLHWFPPVPHEAVPATIATADCSTLMFTPDALNYQFALPNKFFEAVAAGVPLVYGTTQEVNRLAREYDLGVGCDPSDPRSIAEAITTVLEPETNARFRANAVKTREILNWETEEKKLIELYRTLLG